MKEAAVPAITAPTNFGLYDRTHNRQTTLKLLKAKHRQIGNIRLRTGEVLPLLKTGNHDGSIFSIYRDALVLYIKYQEYHYSFLPVKTITQTRLWRDKHLPVTNQFSTDLFFKLILNQTGAILSDKEHTEDGIEFWMRRTGEALQKGLHVALVDFGSQSYQEFSDPNELEAALQASWGGGMETQAYQQKRWAIWK